MARGDGEENWGYAVLAATILLAVIFFFKVIFLISIIMIVGGVLGIIFIYINDEDTDYAFIPVILIIVGVILTPISYYIGYQFEQTPIGKSLVNSAEAIIEADEKIDSIPDEIKKSLDDSINQNLS